MITVTKTGLDGLFTFSFSTYQDFYSWMVDVVSVDPSITTCIDGNFSCSSGNQVEWDHMDDLMQPEDELKVAPLSEEKKIQFREFL